MIVLTEKFADLVGKYKLTFRKARINPAYIEMMMKDFVNAAISEGEFMRADRFYAVAGCAIARVLNLNASDCPEETSDKILDVLGNMMEIMQAAEEDESFSWHDIMLELDERTGIVIHSDHENRLICEYMGKDLDRAKEILEAEGELNG